MENCTSRKETKLVSIQISKICNDIDRGSISFDLAIQRLAGQWSNEVESKLIDSVLKKYGIPAVWILGTSTEEYMKNSVIDGRQRLTTLYRFKNDKIKLHKDIEPLVLRRTDFEECGDFNADYFEDAENGELIIPLAGKRYSELPEIARMLFDDATIDVNYLLYYSDDDIEEMFLRLNSGAIFTKSQKAKTSLGGKVAEKIQEIEELPFWERTSITKRQRLNGDVTATILQCLILLTGWKYKNLGANECIRFANEFTENCRDKDIGYLRDLIIEFDECMLSTDENDKFLKKINIPMLIMNMDKFKGIAGEDFTHEDYSEFLNEWVNKISKESGYMENCGQGSTGVTKVSNRISIMDESLDLYVCKHMSEAA